MTDEAEGRYIVEAKDERGPFDYDRFHDVNEAIKLARWLVRDGCKASDVFVVDSREGLYVQYQTQPTEEENEAAQLADLEADAEWYSKRER